MDFLQQKAHAELLVRKQQKFNRLLEKSFRQEGVRPVHQVELSKIGLEIEKHKEAIGEKFVPRHKWQ